MGELHMKRSLTSVLNIKSLDIRSLLQGASDSLVGSIPTLPFIIKEATR